MLVPSRGPRTAWAYRLIIRRRRMIESEQLFAKRDLNCVFSGDEGVQTQSLALFSAYQQRTHCRMIVSACRPARCMLNQSRIDSRTGDRSVLQHAAAASPSFTLAKPGQLFARNLGTLARLIMHHTKLFFLLSGFEHIRWPEYGRQGGAVELNLRM